MSMETCMSSSLSVHGSHKATYVVNTELGFPTHKAVKLPPSPFPNITTQNGTVVVHPCPQQKRAGPYDGCRHVVSAVQAEAVIQQAATHIRQRNRRGGRSTLGYPDNSVGTMIHAHCFTRQTSENNVVQLAPTIVRTRA